MTKFLDLGKMFYIIFGKMSKEILNTEVLNRIDKALVYLHFIVYV